MIIVWGNSFLFPWKDYSFFKESLHNSLRRLSQFPGESVLFPRDMSNADHQESKLLKLPKELIPIGSLGSYLLC